MPTPSPEPPPRSRERGRQGLDLSPPMWPIRRRARPCASACSPSSGRSTSWSTMSAGRDLDVAIEDDRSRDVAALRRPQSHALLHLHQDDRRRDARRAAKAASSTSPRSAASSPIAASAGGTTRRPRRRCIHFTRATAADWAPRGVTVNAICPGLFMTEPNLAWAKKHPEVIETFVRAVPMGRAGEPRRDRAAGGLSGLARPRATSPAPPS